MTTQFKKVCQALALAGGLILAPIGCSGGDKPAAQPPSEDVSYELFDSTVQLDDQTLNLISSYDQTTGELRFRTSGGQVAELEPKKVILAGSSPNTPRGLLRIVAKVDRDGDEVVLQTVPAPLQLAFRKLHVKFNKTIDLPSDQTLPALRPQYSDSDKFHWESNFYAYDGDGDHATKDDQMWISAEAGTSYDFLIGIDTDWAHIDKVVEKVADCVGAALGLGSDCEMPDVKVGLYAELNGDVSMKMEGAAYKSYEAPFKVANVPLQGFWIGPLFFAPVFTVTGKLLGGASSDVKFDMGLKGGFKGGVAYSLLHGAKEEKPRIDFDPYFDKPKITLQAHGRAELSMRLHLRLYDFMGPYLGVTAYASVDADQTKDPCWSLHGGADVDFGFDIAITEFGPTIADWKKSYNIIDKQIAAGSCGVVPESYHPDSLDGQAHAEEFAHPAFSPWSSFYGGKPLYFLPPLGVGAGPTWLDVSSSVDGRFLVAGSHSEALTKVSETGKPIWSYKYKADRTWYDSINSPYVLPGHTAAASDGTMFVSAYPYVLMNLEQDGRVRWAKSLDLPYKATSARWTSMIADGNGGVYLTGPMFEGNDTYGDGKDTLLARFDKRGDLVWAIRLGSPDTIESPRKLMLDNGGVLVLGNTDDGSTQRFHWLARVSEDGADVRGWAIGLHGCSSSGGLIGAWANNATVLPNGDSVIVGRAIDSSFIVKVKPDGQVGWVKQLNATRVADDAPQIQGLIPLPTSGYLVSGTVGYSRDGHIGTSTDMLWLGMLDGAGQIQWSKRYAGLGEPSGSENTWDIGATLLGTKDGGAILGGYTGAVEDGGVWLTKVPAKDGLIQFEPKLADEGDVGVSTGGDLCAESSSLALPRQALQKLSWKPLTLTAEVVALQTTTAEVGQ